VAKGSAGYSVTEHNKKLSSKTPLKFKTEILPSEEYTKAMTLASKVAVPKRCPGGNPNAVQQSFVSKFCMVCTFVVVFQKLPGDKDVITSESDQWDRYRETLTSYCTLKDMTFTSRYNVGYHFGNLKQMYKAGSWSQEDKKLDKDGKPLRSGSREFIYEEYGALMKKVGFVE